MPKPPIAGKRPGSDGEAILKPLGFSSCGDRKTKKILEINQPVPKLTILKSQPSLVAHRQILFLFHFFLVDLPGAMEKRPVSI